MASIERFEDIQSWQKARKLCVVIFQLTAKEVFSKDFSLKDQIKRSSGSVMDNIAEGFDRSSSKDFRRFLFMSKGSLSEVKSQLYRALDQNYINKEEFREAFSMADETGKLIGGLIKYLDKRINNYKVSEDETVYGIASTEQLPTEALSTEQLRSL
jgi:four helix bundle protein